MKLEVVRDDIDKIVEPDVAGLVLDRDAYGFEKTIQYALFFQGIVVPVGRVNADKQLHYFALFATFDLELIVVPACTLRRAFPGSVKMSVPEIAGKTYQGNKAEKYPHIMVPSLKVNV